MSEQVNVIRSCMTDTFQGILDALQYSNPTSGKERYEVMLKTNSDLVVQSLRKLGDLANIDGGSTWLVNPPGGIASHSTLSAAVSSIEDPVSVIEHSLQGGGGGDSPPLSEDSMLTDEQQSNHHHRHSHHSSFNTDSLVQTTQADLGWLASTASRSAELMLYWRPCAEPVLNAKKRRLDFVAQDLIGDLDSILEQVTSRDPNIKIKTIEDPLLPGMITAVSFSYTHVFQGQFVFSLPTPNNAISIERIEMRGIDEINPSSDHTTTSPTSPSSSSSNSSSLTTTTTIPPSPRSRHRVFESIAAQALAAHDHYIRHQGSSGGSVLVRMLTWIASFGRLFAAECAGCGKMLYLDSSRSPASEGPVFLPPTLRTYESLIPFHPQCCTKKDA